MSTRHDITSSVLNRLGDLDNKVWQRSEIDLYVQDGYDQFCRTAKPLFDIYVIENLPRTGNWQTDLERYFISQKPGWGATDEPFHYTGAHEQNLGTEGRYGPTYRGPSNMTRRGEQDYTDTDEAGEDIPTSVPGGPLPHATVEVLRVTYDQRALYALTSLEARRLDANYENRDGDPQFFTFDKDGIFYLRLIPRGTGGASYDTVSGSWGTMTQTSDSDVSVVTTEVNGHNTGGFGILRHRTDMFPSGGPWGTPTRVHPDSANVRVEVFRLGRSLDTHPTEIPRAYEKYVAFFAMSRALRREGPGQDMELAEHFMQRFAMGIERLTRKRARMDRHRIARFKPGGLRDPFGLGMPQAPYPYGLPH